MYQVVQVVSDTNVGGAGRYLINYLKYFDRSRFAVTVIVPEGSMLTELIRPFEDVKLIEAPYMADRSYDKGCVKYLTALFAKSRPDILHTHASLSARIAGRRAKVPCILATRHCIEPPQAKWKAAITGALNRYLCDYYIAVSDAVAKNLRESGIPKEKIRTVYNGVEPVRSCLLEEIKTERTAYGIQDYEFVFGIFARLEKVKGHRYFLKAARELKKAGYQAKFLIVGDGSLRAELEEAAQRYGLGGDAVFTGYVKDTSLLLNLADVNVISSESEAMSLSILEAMSLGKPTIATNAGGNPEIVKNGRTGLLVGFGDSASLAEAMIKLMEDETLYQEFAHNSLEQFQQNFKAETMVRNLEKLYGEAVKDVH